MDKFFYIIAKRGNTETVYYCSSPTQGAQMVPRALSYCRAFATRAEAKAEIPRLAQYWQGLTDWKVNVALDAWR